MTTYDQLRLAGCIFRLFAQIKTILNACRIYKMTFNLDM